MIGYRTEKLRIFLRPLPVVMNLTRLSLNLSMWKRFKTHFMRKKLISTASDCLTNHREAYLIQVGLAVLGPKMQRVDQWSSPGVGQGTWANIIYTYSYLFGTLRRHIKRVWSSHGSYFGETQSSQNTHNETKRAWYAPEAYQKGTIRYLPYPNSHVGNSDSIVSVWLFKSTCRRSWHGSSSLVLSGRIFAPSFDRKTPAKS